jgi:hypothetical protein
MKKVIKGLILLTFGVILTIGVFAQPPRPPLNQGTLGNQGGSNTGAPIEPGTGVLLMLAFGYGFKKFLEARKIQNCPKN